MAPAAWKRPVFANPDLQAGAVDRDAYVVCVLEGLFRTLQVREVIVSPSLRWADPRAHLLDGPAWEAISEDVLASLSLTDPVQAHLDATLLALDAAWKQMAGRLEAKGCPGRRPAMSVRSNRTQGRPEITSVATPSSASSAWPGSRFLKHYREGSTVKVYGSAVLGPVY